jgi:hypothetical protein
MHLYILIAGYGKDGERSDEQCKVRNMQPGIQIPLHSNPQGERENKNMRGLSEK